MPRAKKKTTKPAKAKIGALHPDAVIRFALLQKKACDLRATMITQADQFDHRIGILTGAIEDALIVQRNHFNDRIGAVGAKIEALAAIVVELDKLLRDELSDPLTMSTGTQP